MTSADSIAPPEALTIAIIGAGLGGLAAAAGLRKQGHDVQIFESSSMNKEIGAAIGLSANALRALAYLGFHVENLRATDYFGMTWFNSNGAEGAGKFDALYDPKDTFGRPGIFCHRSDLHDELKRLAIMEEGPGKPATIHLKCDVQSCDPVKGSLTLKNGETYQADLIVGADGIHSTIRTSLLGYEQTALPSGRAAFRCLLDASKLEGRTEFDWLFSGTPGARGVRTQDGRYMFVYLCRDKTLVNIVAHYPDPRDQDKFHWNAPATKEELISVFSDFAPEYRSLLELVDGPVHLWQIRALPCLPTWINGRTALIGDAAHATFPTIGQGAAMAIEDAVTMACLFPSGTDVGEIPSRLEAYQTIRKSRGEFVLTESVEQVTVPSKRGLFSRSKEMQAEIVGHDAVQVAQEYMATHLST
ncbi:hypothetical protein C8R47DRAFT_1031902 [Mycena vitilis]|nr:hypothetical protein C8R47DRAFT_1031902 [Mycena vitilis]